MYYTVSEAGYLLGVCATTIRRWDNKKQIKCMRTPGGHRRIHISEIDRIAGEKRRYQKRREELQHKQEYPHMNRRKKET